MFLDKNITLQDNEESSEESSINVRKSLTSGSKWIIAVILILHRNLTLFGVTSPKIVTLKRDDVIYYFFDSTESFINIFNRVY